MSTTKVNTVETILESFPIPIVARITGQPAYERIKELNEELNANASSISTTRGGGAHGHLALTVSATTYATLSANNFVAPTLPPAVNPAGMTGPQLTNANRINDEEKAEYFTYQNIQAALKKQIIHAVEPIFLQAVRAPYVGFANKTAYDLLKHLYDTYANISADDLENNDKNLREPWDPNSPFQALVKQIKDAADYADHAGVPYSPEQIVTAAYNNVDNTGVFAMDCREWRNKPKANKTWANFQTFFQQAHNDWDQHTKKSGARARYGQANSTPATNPTNPPLEEATITALANFASSTASDRATLSKLTDTVQELTAELKAARVQIDFLKTQRAPRDNEYGRGRGRGSENRDPNKGNGSKHYCSTHGFCSDHPSFLCPSPAEGHKRNATAKNIMNGSTDKLDEHLQYMEKRTNRRK